MSLAKIALFTALSQVFAVVLVYFCQGFDQTRFFLALFLLPAIAVLALTHAWNRIKAQDEHTIAPCNKSWSSLSLGNSFFSPPSSVLPMAFVPIS